MKLLEQSSYQQAKQFDGQDKGQNVEVGGSDEEFIFCFNEALDEIDRDL